MVDIQLGYSTPGNSGVDRGVTPKNRAISGGTPIGMSNGPKRFIYACDIGSTKQNNFGWARFDPTAPGVPPIGLRCIQGLVDHIVRDLRAGASVALGIEAPCFLPVPCAAVELSSARKGEGNRPWSAPAGAAVTALGVHQTAWILREIRQALGGMAGNVELTTNWMEWPPSNGQILLLYEAFVSGAAHSKNNNPIDDSATAAFYFLANEAALCAINAVTASPCISLVWAAALWAGWVTNLTGIGQQILVVRP